MQVISTSCRWANLETRLWTYLLAVLLPVSARSLAPPQLETHHGADQIHHHGDKEENDGGRLARLRSAEGAVHAVVEDGIGAEPAPSRVPDVDDSWATSSKRVTQRNVSQPQSKSCCQDRGCN